MNMLPYDIHNYLTKNRRRPASEGNTHTVATEQHKPFPKEYPRMPRIKLSEPIVVSTTLQATIARRRSEHKIVTAPLSLDVLSTILHTLSGNERGSRRYPSGGGKYPSEAYALVQNVGGLERGVYHYNTNEHALEHLWGLPSPMQVFLNVNKWVEDSRAVIIFTSSWWKSTDKYQDFSYLLSVLEIGHAAQNLLLSAASLETPACPLGGFNDDRVAELFDLDLNVEQPVYAIALG